ncbi:MAG: hypothetical protein QM644_12015 [Mobilitalea sp.]
MNKKKLFYVGEYILELIVPDDLSLKDSLKNNINAYNENGQLVWNIAELLKDFSIQNGLKYFDDMYFDIRVLYDDKIFCMGYINHCEIDLKEGRITKIVNNR